MSDRSNLTTGYLIDKYIEIRDYVQTKQKELDEHLKVYKEGMKNIEGEVLDRLNKDDAQSAKAQSGAIAFRQLATHVRVTDRDAWIAWLQDNWQYGRNMLTTHVTKEAIKQYMEDEKSQPDGIEVTQIWGVNFRKG